MQKFLIIVVIVLLAGVLWMLNTTHNANMEWRLMSPTDQHYYGQTASERRVNEAIDRALAPHERLN